MPSASIDLASEQGRGARRDVLTTVRYATALGQGTELFAFLRALQRAPLVPARDLFLPGACATTLRMNVLTLPEAARQPAAMQQMLGQVERHQCATPGILSLGFCLYPRQGTCILTCHGKRAYPR